MANLLLKHHRSQSWRDLLFLGLVFIALIRFSEASQEGSVEHLEVIGADRDKDNFEKVTVHMRYLSENGILLFDVLVFAKNEINIVHSKDRRLYGINACAATKSNNITLVYLKDRRLVIAPHADDWIVDNYGWWYIDSIDADHTSFKVEQEKAGVSTETLDTASVFK